jgi:hypothetical protein
MQKAEIAMQKAIVQLCKALDQLLAAYYTSYYTSFDWEVSDLMQALAAYVEKNDAELSTDA